MALEAVASKPAIGEDAPEYASGVAKWKGAAPTLKPKATSIRPTPIPANGSRFSIVDHEEVRESIWRLPFHKYSNDIPYMPIADATEPTIKYFVPASPPISLSL